MSGSASGPSLDFVDDRSKLPKIPFTICLWAAELPTLMSRRIRYLRSRQ